MPLYRDAMDTVRAVLAAENGCRLDDLLCPEVQIYTCPAASKVSPLMRRYARPEPRFTAVSTGDGAVVSGSTPIVATLQELFSGISRDAVFETARLARVAPLLESCERKVAGPHLRLVCGDDTWIKRSPPAGVTVVVERFPADDRLLALVPALWPNAITVPSRRLQTRLALAHVGDVLVGVASMSADTEQLWQIGLDVLERVRGSGVGAALTSILAREALREQCIPFHGVAFPNLASVRTALAAGFRPGWVEAYSR